MKGRGLRTAVVDRDLNQQVFRGRLGVLDEDVEVTILIEHAGIDQLVLEFVAAAFAVGLDEIAVWKRRLRVLVQVLHVRVRRRRVEIEVVLLDVLAVVALAVGQTKQPFLEDGVLAVPERDGETEDLLVVGDAGEAVFSPSIGSRARLIVGEVIPRVARIAVILAHGAPLPLTQIGSPLAPRGIRVARLGETQSFSGCLPIVRRHHSSLHCLPGAIGIVEGHGPRRRIRSGPQIFLANGAVVIDDEGHDTGGVVLGRPGDERKAT